MLFLFSRKNNRKETLSNIKSYINEWAETLPDLRLKNFGDKIEIINIYSHQVGLMRIDTLYDIRNLEVKEEVMQENFTFHNKVRSPENIDVWKYPLSESNKFDSFKKSFRLSGTEHTVICPDCGGKAVFKCESCDGFGHEVCPRCAGRGKTDCTICGGTGNSNYKIPEKEPVSCRACDGNGEFDCSKCSGTGKVPCPDCNGSGEIKCDRCKGEGKIVNYYQINQTFRHRIFTKTIIQPELLNEYPNFTIDPKVLSAIKKDEFDEKELPGNLFEETPLNDTYRYIIKQLNQSPQDIEHPFRISKQHLELGVIKVYNVIYNYRSEKYQLLIYTFGNKWKVFAQEGPFVLLETK